MQPLVRNVPRMSAFILAALLQTYLRPVILSALWLTLAELLQHLPTVFAEGYILVQ